MRFSYAETFCDPTFLAPFARAAEDAGYDSFIVPDSVLFPAESDTRYPYTADGDRAFLEDKPIIEPFALIPFLAAQTKRIRFTTFVLKLAIRPPVLVAKQAASIAVMSNDRLRLGVGISPWPEDFAALGLPWDDRGKRMDECVDIVARTHERRLVRVPRRRHRSRALQDLADARAADSDLDRRPRRAGTAARRVPRRRLDPRGWRSQRARSMLAKLQRPARRVRHRATSPSKCT